MLTGRWSSCDQTLVVDQTSFDQMKSSGTDRTLSESRPDAGFLCPVNSREVLERDFLDRTCPVSADWMLVRIR